MPSRSTITSDGLSNYVEVCVSSTVSAHPHRLYFQTQVQARNEYLIWLSNLIPSQNTWTISVRGQAHCSIQSGTLFGNRSGLLGCHPMRVFDRGHLCNFSHLILTCRVIDEDLGEPAFLRVSKQLSRATGDGASGPSLTYPTFIQWEKLCNNSAPRSKVGVGYLFFVELPGITASRFTSSRVFPVY